MLIKLLLMTYHYNLRTYSFFNFMLLFEHRIVIWGKR